MRIKLQEKLKGVNKLKNNCLNTINKYYNVSIFWDQEYVIRHSKMLINNLLMCRQ